MTINSSVRAMTALISAGVLAACSGGPGLTTTPAQIHNFWGVANTPGPRFASRLACPAKGPIVYVSDPDNNAITVYRHNSRCGLIGFGSGLNSPVNMYVQQSTHDLYVANWGA